jgi:hypothetical protein
VGLQPQLRLIACKAGWGRPELTKKLVCVDAPEFFEFIVHVVLPQPATRSRIAHFAKNCNADWLLTQHHDLNQERPNGGWGEVAVLSRSRLWLLVLLLGSARPNLDLVFFGPGKTYEDTR